MNTKGIKPWTKTGQGEFITCCNDDSCITEAVHQRENETYTSGGLVCVANLGEANVIALEHNEKINNIYWSVYDPAVEG